MRCAPRLDFDPDLLPHELPVYPWRPPGLIGSEGTRSSANHNTLQPPSTSRGTPRPAARAAVCTQAAAAPDERRDPGCAFRRMRPEIPTHRAPWVTIAVIARYRQNQAGIYRHQQKAPPRQDRLIAMRTAMHGRIARAASEMGLSASLHGPAPAGTAQCLPQRHRTSPANRSSAAKMPRSPFGFRRVSRIWRNGTSALQSAIGAARQRHSRSYRPPFLPS